MTIYQRSIHTVFVL